MSQDTAFETGADVVSFLKSQHEQIKMLFTEVQSSRGKDREDAFFELRRLLAVHETAEELIVHPRARKEIADGERVIDARLQEEHDAKEALADLEKLDLDSLEFDAALERLRFDVVAHATAEETEEFSLLEAYVDDEELESMRRAAETAERLAPTRPHAGVESQTANALTGPFAAMLDRARDAFSHRG